ncbi:MAG: FliM/FliN family flagellar motor switch protein [Phycisphaeraceae bacterium]|nr:FliM/FliN family flagellar motor switch protein [Phycisphaeraceae bacterium]
MATDLDTILKLKVPLIVTVGAQRTPLDTVLTFGPGSIIELSKPADEPLEILINNKEVGTGEAIKVGENFGIRITEMLPAEERVAAMGG